MGNPELRPCPFCGIEPHVVKDGDCQSSWYYVKCECEALCAEDPWQAWSSPDDAVAVWNTRPTEDRLRGLLREIKKLGRAAEATWSDDGRTCVYHGDVASIKPSQIFDIIGDEELES